MKKIIVLVLTMVCSYSIQAQSCASFTYSQTSGTTFAFTNTSTPPGPIVSISWSFGDGTTSTQANPTHTYLINGYYNVCLIIAYSTPIGILSCTACDSISVQFGLCYSMFTENQIVPMVFSFDSSPSNGPGAITSYLWTFGDGNSSSAANPTHTYTTPGTYNVCLTVSGVDSNNIPFSCIYCKQIIAGSVFAPCNAAFAYNISGPNAYFTDNSSAPGPITSYLWNFGDGGTSTLGSPMHTYTQTGSYIVCLTVIGWDTSNNTLFSCTTCDTTFYINAGNCNAQFGYSQPTATSFQFINTSTGPGAITGYSWDFGDATSSTQANPLHNYTSSGVYTVCLTISGIDAAQNPYSCNICDSVFAGAGIPCMATFYHMQASGSTFNFTNTASGPGPITSYFWTFGDGTSSTVPNPTHTYTTTGNYTVCLTITGTNTNTTQQYTCQQCDTVNAQAGGILCPVNANFTSTTSGNSANFSNTSSCASCASMTYAWSFGDATTSTLQNPSHAYATSGTYNVCLITTGYANGAVVCADTQCHSTIVGASNVSNLNNKVLKMYPNPTSDFVELEIPMNGKYSLILYYVVGNIVRKESIETKATSYRISTSSLSSGIYQVSLSDGNDVYRAKLLKQ